MLLRLTSFEMFSHISMVKSKIQKKTSEDIDFPEVKSVGGSEQLSVKYMYNTWKPGIFPNWK